MKCKNEQTETVGNSYAKVDHKRGNNIRRKKNPKEEHG
jgi:hypothetical protein